MSILRSEVPAAAGDVPGRSPVLVGAVEGVQDDGLANVRLPIQALADMSSPRVAAASILAHAL